MLIELGMHKHFRMIAISEHLRNHGYDPTVDKHTRIPGIWEKLRILYNMDIIDARENPINDGEDGKHFIDFNLPVEYEETMWKRAVRGPSEAASSPPLLGRYVYFQSDSSGCFIMVTPLITPRAS